jgi:hypothetical protein
MLNWDDTGVTFKCKDYRIEGSDRYKVMTLAVDEFCTCCQRAYTAFATMASSPTARELLKMPATETEPASTNVDDPTSKIAKR